GPRRTLSPIGMAYATPGGGSEIAVRAAALGQGDGPLRFRPAPRGSRPLARSHGAAGSPAPRRARRDRGRPPSARRSDSPSSRRQPPPPHRRASSAHGLDQAKSPRLRRPARSPPPRASVQDSLVVFHGSRQSRAQAGHPE